MLTPTGLVTALHIAISQLFSSTLVDADSSSGGPWANRTSNVCFRSALGTRRHPRHCSALNTRDSIRHTQHSWWVVSLTYDMVDWLTQLRFLRYDTTRWSILTCAQKLTCSQLNLPHGTKQKRIMKKLKTNIKQRCSEETVRSWSPWSQSWGWRGVYGGKEVGLEPGVKEGGSYGWWKWWADRVRRCSRSIKQQLPFYSQSYHHIISHNICYGANQPELSSASHN